MTLPDDLPVPVDDGAADHLPGAAMPALELAATGGSAVDLAALPDRTVLYAYPRTGVPGEDSLVPDWDEIPGARGCTPEACGFRDHHAELLAAGAGGVYGLSTQGTAYQREAAERLGLPFPILSDADLELTRALRLPSFEAGGETLVKRLTLLVTGGRIERVWYPVFPPDRHAGEVLAWLRANPA
ncbi:MAG TPA: peroxiredoxin [Solirubrobacterales bacterium]